MGKPVFLRQTAVPPECRFLFSFVGIKQEFACPVYGVHFKMFCGALDDRQASRRPAWMKIRGAEPQQNMSAPQKVLFEQKKRGKSGKMGRGRGKTGFRCPRGLQGWVQKGENWLLVPWGPQRRRKCGRIEKTALENQNKTQ